MTVSTLAWTWFTTAIKVNWNMTLLLALAPTRERSSSLFRARRKSLLMRAVTWWRNWTDGRCGCISLLFTSRKRGSRNSHNTISRAITCSWETTRLVFGCPPTIPKKRSLLTPS